MSFAAAPPVEHPMLAGLAAVSAELAGLVEVNAWSMAGADVEAGLELLTCVEARLAAVKLALVGEADGRRLGRADGAVSTAAWLRQRLLTHPSTAARTVELAGALRGPCTATGGALSAGQLSPDHARTIVAAMASLPPVGAGVRARAEEFLIAQASVLDPVLLARAGRALAQTLHSTPDADERARRAEAARTMSRAVAADGMVCWHGWLDPEADAVLCAALDPLAAPHPANDGTPDPRTPGRRRADALIDLARLALASPAMPDSGGLRPTLNVTIDWQTLSEQLTSRTAGGGRLHTGEPIAPEAARRIGCDAKILPILLGSAGQPLDIGRSTRTITATIRAALNVRDNGCAFPAATHSRPGATATTSPTGPTAAKPPCTTSSCSAATTTKRSTTTAGPSPSTKATASPPSTRHPGPTPPDNPDATTGITSASWSSTPVATRPDDIAVTDGAGQVGGAQD